MTSGECQTGLGGPDTWGRGGVKWFQVRATARALPDRRASKHILSMDVCIVAATYQALTRGCARRMRAHLPCRLRGPLHACHIECVRDICRYSTYTAVGILNRRVKGFAFKWLIGAALRMLCRAKQLHSCSVLSRTGRAIPCARRALRWGTSSPASVRA